jgi:hypothetical protein
MKVLGSAVPLSASANKLSDAVNVHVTNTNANPQEVSLFAGATGATGGSAVGSVYVAGKGSVEISLGLNQGIRGATDIYASPIAKSGI